MSKTPEEHYQNCHDLCGEFSNDRNPNPKCLTMGVSEVKCIAACPTCKLQGWCDPTPNQQFLKCTKLLKEWSDFINPPTSTPATPPGSGTTSTTPTSQTGGKNGDSLQTSTVVVLYFGLGLLIGIITCTLLCSYLAYLGRKRDNPRAGHSFDPSMSEAFLASAIPSKSKPTPVMAAESKTTQNLKGKVGKWTPGKK